MKRMRAAFLLSIFSGWLMAQSTATLNGTIFDSGGAVVPGAKVTLSNALTRFEKATESQADGSFSMTNVPFGGYQIEVLRAGFARKVDAVALRSNVPVTIKVSLTIGAAAESVTVSAIDTMQLVDPEATGTKAQMNIRDIEKMAVGVGTKGIEAVLLSFPGFSQNANGAIHPRGAHNQMTYVVDGMPISDQLTGGFANGVDPNVVQTIEMYTGNIPAEYGNKVSSVVNITTTSGLGSGRKFGGSVMVNGGGFDTLGQVTTVGGEYKKLGYTALVNTMKSHRYLDAVSLDNVHNGGDSERAFLRLDYQASSRNTMRFNMMGSNSSFELANLRSQQANVMRSRQQVQDFAMMFGIGHTFDARSTFDSTTSVRTSSARLSPSAGDLPVTASQARRMATWTFSNRYNAIRGAHNIKIGYDLQYFPVKEFFTFGVTDPNFNDPASEDYNPSLAPYDLGRGGRLFQFFKRQSGTLMAPYFQDNIKLGRFLVSLGLRYDRYQFLSKGYQMQPRVGISYSLPETGTVFRASYNRTYMPPPLENLLMSNTPEGAVLAPPGVVATLGGAVALITPERQNFYELGIQQALFRRISLNASFYHKNAQDQQDNNNFFNTGIIFPASLAKIRVNGAEGRIVVSEMRGFSGTIAFTHSRAITTPPFTGGLFIGNDAVDLLSAGPFVIDHDQKLAVQGTLNYANRRGFYANLTVRYDSGLVSNPSDPAEVAADPDYSDLLPLVTLTTTPARVNPRTITDVVLGYTHSVADKRKWDASVIATNLFDQTALYNFQSIFVGTRLVQPRTLGARIRYYF